MPSAAEMFLSQTAFKGGFLLLPSCFSSQIYNPDHAFALASSRETRRGREAFGDSNLNVSWWFTNKPAGNATEVKMSPNVRSLKKDTICRSALAALTCCNWSCQNIGVPSFSRRWFSWFHWFFCSFHCRKNDVIQSENVNKSARKQQPTSVFGVRSWKILLLVYPVLHTLTLRWIY